MESGSPQSWRRSRRRRRRAKIKTRGVATAKNLQAGSTPGYLIRIRTGRRRRGYRKRPGLYRYIYIHIYLYLYIRTCSCCSKTRINCPFLLLPLLTRPPSHLCSILPGFHNTCTVLPQQLQAANTWANSSNYQRVTNPLVICQIASCGPIMTSAFFPPLLVFLCTGPTLFRGDYFLLFLHF